MIDKQEDWAKHLQAVALSYRLTSTSLGLSPFEVLHGFPMPLAIDNSLQSDDTSVGSPFAYAKDVKAKLDVLQLVAMQNAEQSAARHRLSVNQDANQPKYELGDKVLLSNPVVKKGESKKLKMHFSGPYIIVSVESGYNYRLQDLTSGKPVRRPVHAERLRPLWEMDNDYRKSTMPNLTSLFTGHTIRRKIQVTVEVCDLLQSSADVIVQLTDTHLQPIGEISKHIAQTFSTTLQTVNAACIAKHGAPKLGEILSTDYGDSDKPRLLKQLVVSSNGEQIDLNHSGLVDLFYRLFSLTDTNSLASLIMPFPMLAKSDDQVWLQAQSLLDGLKKFEDDSHTNSTE